MADFSGVSILLPVMNETTSLKATVDEIQATCQEADIQELILLVSPKTQPESLALCGRIQQDGPFPCVIHEQKLPFLGGALREGFSIAKGSHTLMMASDLETDPSQVSNFIAEAKKKPEAIIASTRWAGKGSFSGYNPVKLVLNFFFQKFFSLAFRTRLTDLTYGFRIYPSDLMKKIIWEETRHPFLFESLLKPLRLKVAVFEIPVPWRARVEGESQNTFLRNFEYIRTGIKTLFQNPQTWIQQTK